MPYDAVDKQIQCARSTLCTPPGLHSSPGLSRPLTQSIARPLLRSGRNFFSRPVHQCNHKVRGRSKGVAWIPTCLPPAVGGTVPALDSLSHPCWHPRVSCASPADPSTPAASIPFATPASAAACTGTCAAIAVLTALTRSLLSPVCLCTRIWLLSCGTSVLRVVTDIKVCLRYDRRSLRHGEAAVLLPSDWDWEDAEWLGPDPVLAHLQVAACPCSIPLVGQMSFR
jgi:hypothetical protein